MTTGLIRYLGTHLGAYLAERGRPSLLIPAAIVIALAANIGHAIETARIVTSAVVAWLLIAQFRLWDDLADIETDRLSHPDRVLSRTPHLDRFVVFGLLLATTNIAVVAWLAGSIGVVMLIVLDAAMAIWYARRPRHRTLVGDLVVLSKYPGFVLILAGSSSPSVSQVTAAITVYAAACLFEVWHDASSPLRPRVNA
jgi:4-hydroxybenzoate polyprenyltransferase